MPSSGLVSPRSPAPIDRSVERVGTTLSALLKEICAPEARVWYLLFAVVIWAGLDYWISCCRYEPSVPWDIRALYRAEGDTQYVGMTCSLARFIFGEANLQDSFRSGVQGFPVGSLSLHALCVACLGVRGFALADAAALLGSFGTAVVENLLHPHQFFCRHGEHHREHLFAHLRLVFLGDRANEQP